MSDAFAKVQAQQGLAMDANSLNKLSRQARENSPEAIHEVAKQFEAMFINMMMKSMREATDQYNPFDSEQSKTFITMLDQETSQHMANKGIGLAKALEKQLSKLAKATQPSDLSKVKANSDGLALNSVHQGFSLAEKSTEGLSLQERELTLDRPEEIARKRDGMPLVKKYLDLK